jgi:hypothetical protein
MSITTPVTDLLGINHPILLAPMDGVADARLVAAVDAAGGFVGAALDRPEVIFRPGQEPVRDRSVLCLSLASCALAHESCSPISHTDPFHISGPFHELRKIPLYFLRCDNRESQYFLSEGEAEWRACQILILKSPTNPISGNFR